jgi:thiazole synthase
MEKQLDKLKIGNKFFTSRLMLGTGKYRKTTDAINSIQNSQCEIVTVAIQTTTHRFKK